MLPVDSPLGAFGLSPLLASSVTVELLAAILDHIADPIFVKDRSFRWVLLNEAFREMVGYPREQMLGKSDYDFFPVSEADWFRKKDMEMFATGSQVTIEEEPITVASGARKVLATTKVPLRDATGAVTHLVGIIHDITRLKTAEDALRVANEDLERRVAERTAALRAAQAELVRKARLAVVGELAGSVAHQIRNPLTIINNAASVLGHAVAGRSDPQAADAVRIIQEEIHSANRIITELLDYARVRPPTRTPTSLRDVVEEALAAQALDAAVLVELKLDEVPPVIVDPQQLRDALIRLIQNAAEAMPGGGTLTVGASCDGEDVVLSITDTGAGVDAAVSERLFEPLVTTKQLGLGLGLATTRALIENQGGSTSCTSAPGAGTRFDLRLPTTRPSDPDSLDLRGTL